MKTWWNSINLALFLAGGGVATPPGQAAPLQCWVYCSQNLWVDQNIDDLEALLRRAAAAGYTHVLLSDSKFARLGTMDARYFRNVDRVKQLAAELKLELVPALFPIGYSNDLLFHDPNLIEALPVREALLVVTNGVARLAPDPPIGFKGGDFSNLSLWSWKDANVVAENGTARVTDPRGANARIVQTVSVRPFRQHHISVRVKTQDFLVQPEVKVLAGSRAFNYNSLGVKPTQDWQTHHVVFNSLDQSQVNIYFGVWGGTTGTLWWDDAVLEEVAFLNLVRRDGAPLVVEVEDGAALIEGRDFEPLRDPQMGVRLWPGSYDVYHTPPLLRTALPTGTRLRASYYHAVTVYDDQAMICPSEPRTVELLRDQARRMHAAWGAKGYMMSHDEIRVLNWCAACERRQLEAGAILAENARTCLQILREVNPKGRIYVWSDMFDPNHNAHKDYYLVRGDLAGSWEGLDPEVIIVPWYFNKREASLRFFSERGHRQVIAGYYDSSAGQIRDWLNTAKQFRGIAGAMYTTWQRRFTDLERFSEIVREFQSTDLPGSFRLEARRINGGVQLEFLGEADRYYAIETSTGLSGWQEWTNVAGGDALWHLPDEKLSSDPRQFYRAQWIK